MQIGQIQIKSASASASDRKLLIFTHVKKKKKVFVHVSFTQVTLVHKGLVKSHLYCWKLRWLLLPLNQKNLSSLAKCSCCYHQMGDL